MRNRLSVLLSAFLVVSLLFVLSGYPQVTAATSMPDFNETEGPNGNNTFYTANGTVFAGTIIKGTTDYYQAGDYFIINCIANTPIFFYLDGSSNYVCCDFYDWYQTDLNIRINYNQTYTFTPSYSGWFYIKLSGYENVHYTLRVSNQKISENESNNSVISADGPIFPGQSYTGYAEGGGNYDYVKVVIPSSGPVSFYIDGSSWYMTAFIYDSNQVMIGDIRQKQAIFFDNLAAGTYYIAIDGYPGVNYTFYANPNFSMVNSVYFHVLNYSTSRLVTSYKSSNTDNLVSNTVVNPIVYWENHYFYRTGILTTLVWYEDQQTHQSGYKYAHSVHKIGNYTTNGFPILQIKTPIGL